MNHLINGYVLPIYKLISLGLFLAVCLLFVFSNIAKAGDSRQQVDGKLITIHDRGESKVIVATGETIKDALDQAGVSISDNDTVEPALDQKMIATEYQVNIYRARPVIVVDGAVRQKINTPYQTAGQIAKDAGIVVYDDDEINLELSSDLNDGAGLLLIINRATPFNFTLYGKTDVIRTRAKTVSEMLVEKNIKLDAADRLSVDKNLAITEGMSVRLWREGKQTTTVEEEVAFDIDKIEDADQPVGYSLIKTAGQKGLRNVTYEITIADGQEVSRKEIASVTTKQSKKQTEVFGTKATTPAEARIIGHTMMLAAGFKEDQWVCLDKLWTRESQWRVSANNSSSGAYGIPQSLPASKMATFGSDYLTNAATQISWGLNYIKGRYTTPCGAWQHSEEHNWY